MTPLPLTLVLQAPTEDALRQLLSELPALGAGIERTGCHVSVVADGHARDLSQFTDATGRR